MIDDCRVRDAVRCGEKISRPLAVSAFLDRRLTSAYLNVMGMLVFGVGGGEISSLAHL